MIETVYHVNIFFIFVTNFCSGKTLEFAEEFFQHILDDRKSGLFDNSAETWRAVSTSEVFDKDVKWNRTFNIQAIFSWIGFVRHETAKPISGSLSRILSTWITNAVQNFKDFSWFLKYFDVKGCFFCWISFSSWWAPATNPFSAAMRFSSSTFSFRIIFNTEQLLSKIELDTKKCSIFYEM